MTFADGRRGNAVIVGPRDSEKGASLIVPNKDTGSAEAIPLLEGVDLVGPELMIDILCMQERLHGSGGLEPPADLVG